MNPSRLFGRWAVVAVGGLAVLTLVLLAGAPRSGKASPIWTDRPLAVEQGRTAWTPWVELARALKPAVVNISTTRVDKGTGLAEELQGEDPFDQFFRQFFGDVPPHTVQSLGSGFIINPDGYVLTNNHVVDDATTIRVKLSDGREFPARIVGRDRKTDLALLRIEATGLPVVPLGNGDVQVGEPVMAIGNPFGLEQTVTTGIVSATGRVIGAGPYDQFIQTDASINPGNSGGPLINTRGQAIGINTAIVSRDGGSNGIGFAIPISLAKPVVSQLAATGHVVRGWLGVSVQPLTAALAKGLGAPDTNGALVASVLPDSPALTAGLKPGDVIVEYDGRPVAAADSLPEVVAETPVGREVPLTVLRDGRRIHLTARIAQLAESEAAHAAGTPDKASLGLAVAPLTPGTARDLGVAGVRGVLVRGVEEGSRAAEAGIRPGDVIVEVDRHAVATVAELERDLEVHRAGTPILLRVNRRGHELFVAVS